MLRRPWAILTALALTACGSAPQAHQPTTAPQRRPRPAVTTTTARHAPSTVPPTTTTTSSPALTAAGARWVRAATTPTTSPPAPPPRATSSLPTTGDYRLWPDWPLWRAVGLCEQAGDAPEGDGIAWHGSRLGGTPSSGYPGGLGESRDFWRQFAPQAGVTTTNGAYATPGEQIRVARAGSHNGTRMGGWSSWPGCVMSRLPHGYAVGWAP
jgi:hypothetical protein